MVAHLTAPTSTSLPQAVFAAIRARGDFDRMADTWARRRAQKLSPNDLVTKLRASAGSARRMPGSGPMAPLVAILVHAQDIARPLGLAVPPPADSGAVVLTHLAETPFFGTPARIDGLRLIATEAQASIGGGAAEVHGPIQDLLLVATGRPASMV